MSLSRRVEADPRKPMSKSLEHDEPSSPAAGTSRRRWSELGGSWAVLRWLLITAASWFLLKELAPLLRPLLLAVFLAYVILPVGLYVKGHVLGGPGHLAVLAVLGLLVVGIGVLAYGDIARLSHEAPRLHDRLKDLLG